MLYRKVPAASKTIPGIQLSITDFLNAPLGPLFVLSFEFHSHGWSEKTRWKPTEGGVKRKGGYHGEDRDVLFIHFGPNVLLWL